MINITENLLAVQERIALITEKNGRSPGEVQLVAVSKTKPPELILEAIRAGVTDIGENRIQEAQSKFPHLDLPVTKHCIGHIQTNKVKLLPTLFDCVHSLDRLKVARELDKRCEQAHITMPCYIEVNVGEEKQKSGIIEEELYPLLEACLEFEHISLIGLMCLPPFDLEPEHVRPYFIRLRELRDDCQRRGFTGIKGLSMGMTNDFEVAIEEGATCVRIGTAIFGKRHCDIR